MNINSYFQHWAITENPFRAEEARHDPVFARLGDTNAAHPDFEKIVGDLRRPSTSIVFGEKGSGKTAIRLQLQERIEAHNQAHPDARILLVPYDDLNPVVDRLLAHHSVGPGSKDQLILETLRNFRLVDHFDAILHTATTRLVDACLNDSEPDRQKSFPESPAKRLRQEPFTTRQNLILLQAVYAEDDETCSRLRRLCRKLKAPPDFRTLLWLFFSAVGWLPPAALFFAALLSPQVDLGSRTVQIGFILLVAAWLLAVVYGLFWRMWSATRLAKRIHRQVITTGRSLRSLARAIPLIPESLRRGSGLPTDDSDDTRYAMLDRLRAVLRPLGITGIIVVVDRVDEPTLVNGAPDRMRAIVWPLLNNKFLQQDGLGIKMLLPIELRHELFRESTAFFQEARLDKQNLVERLSWTGAMLYDICNARLTACRAPDAEPISLADLFETDVTRQDIIDALDQMHQPRDAFKLLYRCIQEHCSNVTEEQASWRIPRLVLESVRRQQSDRVQEFSRGFRPA